MYSLKIAATALSILFILGATEATNAASLQPIIPTTSQDNIILVRHGHHGWHHHGWHHHGWRHHHHWRGWGGPARVCGWHNGFYYCY